MKKSLFITLALLGSCSAERSLHAKSLPTLDAQPIENTQQSNESQKEIDLFQDEKTRDLFIKKNAWVDTFRKAQTGEISVEIFIYATLELMEELGKSTDPDDQKMYDLCEKIVKNITDAMNQVADQAEANQDEHAQEQRTQQEHAAPTA